MVCLLAMSLSACNPTIALHGVYVPGWLVSVTLGFVLSYLSVEILAHFRASRALSESGVFFCGLGVIFAYVGWFAFFSRF